MQGIDTLERFPAPRYCGDGSIMVMHGTLRRIFAPDGENSRILGGNMLYLRLHERAWMLTG